MKLAVAVVMMVLLVNVESSESQEPQEPQEPRRAVHAQESDDSPQQIEELTKEERAIEYFSKHFSDEGVAYLMGTMKQESGLDPQAVGDNGTAFGLYQWRFERRQGKPSDFDGQVRFAVKEMQRDSLSRGVYETLQGSDERAIKSALDRWIRYEHKGARYEYARQYLSEM